MRLPRIIPVSEQKVLGATPREGFYNNNMQIKKLPTTHVPGNEINNHEEFNKLESAIFQTNLEIRNINKRLDNFYGKMIEIFGIFVAIFSFVLIGGKTALTCNGAWLERTSCSTSIFLPIALVLVLLLYVSHKLKR